VRGSDPKAAGDVAETLVNQGPQSFVSRVTITNNTDTALRRSFESLAAGAFEAAPPTVIPPRQTIEFAVRSQGSQSDPRQQSLGATLGWEPDGNPADTWSLSFAANTGFDPTAESVTNSKRFAASQPEIRGTDFRFAFRLSAAPMPPQAHDPAQHPTDAEPPTLRLGDKNGSGWVEKLQCLLNEKVDPSPNLKPDGHFGPATHTAVLALQHTMQAQDPSVRVDGIVGSQAWARLQSKN
jgi:hypothetical protein